MSTGHHSDQNLILRTLGVVTVLPSSERIASNCRFSNDPPAQRKEGFSDNLSAQEVLEQESEPPRPGTTVVLKTVGIVGLCGLGVDWLRFPPD